MSNFKIVKLEERFIPGMLQVAHAIHAQSIYWDMDLDEGKLTQQFLAAETPQGPNRWFRLAVLGDRVVGGFHGERFRTFFGNQLVIKDLGWWVSPEMRNHGAATDLIDAFEDWGRSFGAVKCFIGYNGIRDIEIHRRVFEYHGYSVTGYNTCKEL